MPVFTAIGTAVAAGIGLTAGTAAFATVVGVTAFGAQVAAGVGLNILAQQIAGQPSPSAAPPASGPGFGVQVQLTAGADRPRSFPLGWSVTAGSFAYGNVFKVSNQQVTPNSHITQVIIVSDLPLKRGGGDGSLPIHALKALWVNGKKAAGIDLENEDALLGYPVEGYEASNGNPLLWIRFYDGTQTEADPLCIDKAKSDLRPYANTRILTGCAYAVVTAKVNETEWAGRHPEFRFELYGIKLYDVSKDTTAGGDGAHRWSDRSTWGGDGDDNPVVQLYNLFRGITYEGEWFYGLQGLTAARLPAENWIAQIEKCREAVDAPGGGEEPRYRAGGEILINNDLGSTIESRLTACQGKISEFGGVYTIHVGAPDDPITELAFTDDDIVSTESQSFTPFFGLSDTVTGITARYPDPENGWNTESAPPIYRTDYEELAGNRRLLADVSLDCVPYPRQVQQLMQESLQDAQRQRRITVTLPPKWFRLTPGDIIPYSSVRNGFEDKLFRVDGVIVQPSLDVIVDLTEVDPNDYDWDTDTDYTPLPSPGDPGFVAVDDQAVEGFEVIGIIVTDESGAIKRPAIRCDWDTDDLDDTSGIHIQVRKDSDDSVIIDTTINDVDLGYCILQAGAILSATDYEVRARFVPLSARTTEWTSWLPVLTPDVRFEFADLGPVMRDTLFDQFRAELDELRTTMEQIAASALDRIGTQWEKQEKQTISLNVVRDNASASINQLATTIIGEGGALATLVTEIESTYATISALGEEIEARSALQDEFTTFAGPEGTFATHVESLSSTYAPLGDFETLEGAFSTLSNEWSTFSGPEGTFATHVESLSSTYAALGDFETLESAVSTLESEWSTFSGPSGTFATFQSTVSSTYVTNTNLTTNYATITTIASTYATQAAFASQYTITLDTGGRISGIKLFNGSGISSFIVQADIFQMWKSGVNGGDPVPIFEVGTVDGVTNRLILRGTIYADAVITTRTVADENITVIASSMGSDKTNVGSDFPSRNPIIHQQAFTIKAGAVVDVMFTGEFDFTKNDTDGGSISDSLTIDLFIDGVAQNTGQLIKCVFSSGASRIRHTTTFNRTLTGLSAGSRTFEIQCISSNFNTGANVRTVRKPFFRIFQRLR